MKYAIEMGSGAMIHILNFIKKWVRHSKADGGYRETQDEDCIGLFSFFQNYESNPKENKK
jgi:hypothetical protein